VIACYGMNDGIYQPLNEERFQKFKDGINWLHEQVLESGAKIIHVTPPTYDAQTAHVNPFADGSDYNTVLDQYSAWLVDQRTNHWEVIDVHHPMNQFLIQHRDNSPRYALTQDGVHPGALGHWLIAREILLYLGAPAKIDSADTIEQTLPNGIPKSGLLKTVTELDSVLRDAWLTETKYKRPGIAAGLPMPEAEDKEARLQAAIRALVVTLNP
jgi:hypothetical protein